MDNFAVAAGGMPAKLLLFVEDADAGIRAKIAFRRLIDGARSRPQAST